MRTMSGFFAIGLTLGLVTFAFSQGNSESTPEPDSDAGCVEDPSAVTALNLLIFSKTAGYRHDSIPAGIEALESLAEDRNWTVTATDDATVFDNEALAGFDVVIFLSTTGDILDSEQEAAFERFIQDGGGYVGIHAASDTEYEWAWYGGLVGAYFADHPPGVHIADVLVENAEHPAAETLPDVWTREDEWYNFRQNPREAVEVILSLDETSYQGGTMEGDHPVSWSHEYDGGRAFYTAMGHTIESFSETLFLEHLIGGIEWAGGRCDEP